MDSPSTIETPSLYHCFPRPSLVSGGQGQSPVRVVQQGKNSVGLEILESIICDGLVCTSEVLRAWTDPLRVEQMGEKRELREITRQTRACFTLCTADDLARPLANARFRDHSGRESTRPASHLDLFGSFGIGLDPLHARRIGVMPAMYFYTVSGTHDDGPEAILRRLAEARQALMALHMVEERSGRVRIPWVHTEWHEERASSQELGFTVDKAGVRARLSRLSSSDAASVFDLFDVDKRTSWQIVDKIDFILGLFQNTDSFIEDSPLAFYEQREWRLPYMSQMNLGWYSLGKHPRGRDPDRRHNNRGARRVRALLESAKGRPLTEEEAKATWVLFEVDKAPFATLISEIVCPPDQADAVGEIVARAQNGSRLRRDVKVTPLGLPRR